MANEYYPELRLKIIVFGDGLQGQLLKISHGLQSKDGVREVECVIRPTRELFNYMGLSDQDLNPRNNAITMRYPEHMVITLNDDPSVGTVLVMCDFFGRDTPLTALNAKYIYTIQGKDKIIKALKGETAVLHQEIKKITSQDEKHMEEQRRKLSRIMSLRGSEFASMTPPEGNSQTGIEYPEGD